MSEKNPETAEEIRNLLDTIERNEYLNRDTGKWYTLKDGELVQIGGDDGDEEAA